MTGSAPSRPRVAGRAAAYAPGIPSGAAFWPIGETPPRREDRALLRGEGRFFCELLRPDLARRGPGEAAGAAAAGARAFGDPLHLAVVRSPVAHGVLEGVDTATLRAEPGVLLVLTAADLAANGPLPMIDRLPDQEPAEQPVLAAGRVLYPGQPVAAVVAGSAAEARAAAARAALDIAPLPAILDAEDALDAAAIHGARNAVQTLTHRVGDPDAAFAAAAVIVEEEFRFHRVGASPMEPRGVAAAWDATAGRMTLASTTQVPGSLRVAVAALLGLDPAAVGCESLQLGGGFGCKEAVYPEEILVAVAARALGRPVVWRETRPEHLVATSQGREGSVRLRMALDADGIATALEVDGLSDIGAFYGFAGNIPGAAMGGMVRGPYRIPHFAARTRSVATHKTPLNVYRGAGHPQAVFAMERLMDRAAAATGLDRIEIRRRNLIPADAFPADRGVAYHDAGPIIYDSGDYARCLDEALAAIDAAGFAARRATFERDQPGMRLGLGLAMVVEITSTGPHESVAFSVAPDGRVIVETAAIELGQRAVSALTQIASAELGLPAAAIEVRTGAPIALAGGGTFASRGTPVGGAAVADGAARLEAAAIALHAERTGLSADALAWEEGAIVERGGRNAPVTLAELAADPAGRARLAVTGTFSVPRSSFASAAHAAVVSVEVETGIVAVLDYAVAHDCGRVLNPAGVEDQIAGGVMQGLGATLFEALPLAGDGTPLARGLLDYVVPVAANLPRFLFRHVETPSPINPLGLKGCGEAGFSGAPAAITGALEDALTEFGLRLTDDGPYTPSRVLGLLLSPPAEHSPEEVRRP